MEIKILIVDDEIEICRMFTKYLSSKEFSVKSASNGKKAIHMVKKENFDTVFLDIVMPGIQASDVLDKIKKISPQTKVIIITGKLLDEDLKDKMIQKGASGYLQKPFCMEEIERSLDY